MVEKQIDGSMALAEKEYRIITIEATEKEQTAELRVAAYARVSSASDDQLNSFAAQNRYYTTLISGKENWHLVDIYADEGITGTSAEKRPDFQRLLADCRRGKIDRVLVKSISRFARNTKECLEATRELKALGIGICFEKENIDTATMSGEMMTALFASFAQAESESISGNMRWSYQKRMQSGTFLPAAMPYGYRIVNKAIEIKKDEAEIVCEIFQKYLDGMSKPEIAKMLNARHIPSGQSKSWHSSSVAYILSNERYLGNSLWQKTCSSDTLPVYRFHNKGEQAKYYAEDTHPAIISNVVFHKVQDLREQRKKDFARLHQCSSYPFSKIIVCGQCGGTFRRKVQSGSITWVCMQHEREKKNCSLLPIQEEQIYNAFLRLYYKLKHNGMTILSGMLSHLQTLRIRRMLWSLDIIDLNKQISDLTSQNQMLAALKQQGLIDPDIFIAQSNELAEQLRTAKLQKEHLMDVEDDDVITRTRELMEIIDAGPDFLETFDEELFGELIDKIIVENNTLLRFRLKNGLELAEPIERTVR